MLRQGVVFGCGTTRTTVLYFFPRSFSCSFFASCASLALIYDYLKKNWPSYTWSYFHAVWPISWTWIPFNDLLAGVMFWKLWKLLKSSAGTIGNITTDHKPRDEYVFLRFFFILFIRQISWQTLNLCPSPVFETLFNEFKNACVFSQLVIQLINRNRL